MAQTPDRPKRPGGKPNGRRPDAGKPARGGRRDHGKVRDYGKPGEHGKPGGRGKSGERGKPGGKATDKPWTSAGRPARGDRSVRRLEPPEDRDPYGIKSVRSRHDDPELPDDVQAKELDRVARAQLRTLSKENAETVARHLAMAARWIQRDPQLAHRHALSAARRAGRIAVVRETLAITAYSIGDFALALRELRTYRRISGRDDQLPMMVDSERGLGRPEKALELARSVERSSLPTAVRVELAIAMSGARLDLGQAEAALLELEIPELDPDVAFPWSPALFDAYAVVLEELGREAEARQWWDRSERAAEALDAGRVDSDAEAETVEVIEEDLIEGDSAEAETIGKETTDVAVAQERADENDD